MIQLVIQIRVTTLSEKHFYLRRPGGHSAGQQSSSIVLDGPNAETIADQQSDTRDLEQGLGENKTEYAELKRAYVLVCFQN